jgi:hypothetical protein
MISALSPAISLVMSSNMVNEVTIFGLASALAIIRNSKVNKVKMRI